MTTRKLLVLGTRIGKVTMPKEIVSDLISITDESVNLNEDFGYALAGQIKNEKIITEKDIGPIWGWLQDEVSIYIKNILKKYLPEIFSEQQTLKLVKEVIAQTSANNLSDMGKVMSAVMQQSNGKVDGGIANRLVKELLE